ncbi:DUF4651 domain-containing protein [Streptococcus sp. H49]|uniref:DUF4651 domain-containing protein n=1 Tax=Streptococcus huangxiaojuni TaxID=3237239 RepID=UPI0034A5820E
MKNKKGILISGAGFLILGSAFLIKAALEKRRQIKKYELAQAELRQFFGRFGEIAVLYINEAASDKETIRGGAVMADGTIYHFLYKDDSITFREEKQ